MADINHLISLGLGSPAGIQEFLTFGLQIGEAAASTSEVIMRKYGILEPPRHPVSPEYVAIAKISSAGAVIAQDYPDGAHLVRFGSEAGFFFNHASTAIAAPTTSWSASTASSLAIEYLSNGDTRQIVSGSTGYSVTSNSSGYISLSFWGR